MKPQPLLWPATHGALDFAELERLGLGPDDVLDFSVNSNPYGPTPEVRAAVAATPLDRYPDRECLALRRALSERLKVSTDGLVIGNGTAELITLLALAFLQPGDRVLIFGPTFGEYARAAAMMRATPDVWWATPQTGFAVRAADLESAFAQDAYRAVYVCNPNNPTGRMIAPDVLAGWAAARPRTLFVVDEAYAAFASGRPSLIGRAPANMVVLRSMTKDYALAGLRLGYAVGDPARIAALAALRPAWNVNALAQAAGLAALKTQAATDSALRRVRAERRYLMTGLAALGLRPCSTETHFFLTPVGQATAFRAHLLARRILVRDCTSFGLPDFVRIAPRTRPENSQLLEAIADLRHGASETTSREPQSPGQRSVQPEG